MDETERVSIDHGVIIGRAPGRDGGGRDLRADVYRPPARLDPPAAGWPAILLVHGGAWRGGDRGQLRGYGILLARAGWLAVACEYRLTPEARWPEHLHDVKTALRWMRASAPELHIDPARIAISGNSAGGHLALVAAGTPDVAEMEGDGGHAGAGTGVAACIAIYPPTVLYADVAGGVARPVEMLTDEPTEEIAREASPVTWAKPGFPPTLLIHGSADTVVPVKSSFVMYDALRKEGVPVDLHIYADQPHAFDAAPAFGRRTADEILLFLDRYVGATVPA
jgi:acetyl esterase/lipase